MSLLADSSPSPKIPVKRSYDNGGLNHRGLLSNFKPQKLNAVQSFPANCGNSIKRPKVDVAWDYPEDCGLLANGINRAEMENSIDVKYAMAIPAVPLRSVPIMNEKTDPEKSVSSDSKNYNVGKELAKENENEICSREELWRHESEKLAALIADAKSYLNDFDVKYSTSKCTSFGEPKQLMDTVKPENGPRNLDESLSQKATNVEYRISKVVQGKNKTGSESSEEEICVLSPEEWSELQPCITSKRNAIVTYSDTSIKAVVVNSDNALKHDDYDKDLINLSLVPHDHPQAFKVMETLKLFEEHYERLVKEHKAQPRGEKKNYTEAVERLKLDGKCFAPDKPFGYIPGIEIGHEFQFRAQLAAVGLHRQLISGIDTWVLDGKNYATSIIDSGRYENTAKTRDILIYSGQGGNLKIADNSVDQKLEKGNLALMNSMEMGYPVRVTYKRKHPMESSKAFGTSLERNIVFVYDGLYKIKNAWRERDPSGKLVFKFELHRMLVQGNSNQTNDLKLMKLEMRTEVCMMHDISQGKEKMSIRAMNGVDDDMPPSFTYVTDIVYPYWYREIEPVGCDCVDGCSDIHPCPCVKKNGGEIPYNENGLIVKAKPKGIVHECGPSCKCPPSCMNRVSQHGRRHQLEIFKTEKSGWGVRSRDSIPSGSFVCEYVGEFLHDKEAELRVDNDEYLFDIFDSRNRRFDGYTIDTALFGNIGRFINHSCSPNMYAQNVIYDHGDKKMPHIMYFATEDIPPLQELSYDYNYKVGQVRDANGNIKTKACYCGSHECSGRMY